MTGRLATRHLCCSPAIFPPTIFFHLLPPPVPPSFSDPSVLTACPPPLKSSWHRPSRFFSWAVLAVAVLPTPSTAGHAEEQTLALRDGYLWSGSAILFSSNLRITLCWARILALNSSSEAKYLKIWKEKEITLNMWKELLYSQLISVESDSHSPVFPQYRGVV